MKGAPEEKSPQEADKRRGTIVSRKEECHALRREGYLLIFRKRIPWEGILFYKWGKGHSKGGGKLSKRAHILKRGRLPA